MISACANVRQKSALTTVGDELLSSCQWPKDMERTWSTFLSIRRHLCEAKLMLFFKMAINWQRHETFMPLPQLWLEAIPHG